MRTLLVVELEIAGEALPSLTGAAVGVQVHLLLFDGAPEALGEDVVQGAAFAVHADLDAPPLQALQILRAGEVGALITIPDCRTAHRQGLIDRREHEADLQALVQFPGDHIGSMRSTMVREEARRPNDPFVAATRRAGVDVRAAVLIKGECHADNRSPAATDHRVPDIPYRAIELRP